MLCSNCGSNAEQGQYCRKCGSPLVDTEARTVPITNQVLMDITDILIEIKTELNRQKSKSSIVKIVYADVDREYKLPAGSTEQHIEQAAQESDLEIINKGSTRAELRRRPLRVQGFPSVST